MKRFFVALLMIFACLRLAYADATAEVLKADAAWRSARTQQKEAAMRDMTTADFTVIDHNGKQWTREEFIGWMKSGKGKISYWLNKPTGVHIHPMVAIVTTISELSGTIEMKPGDRREHMLARATRVWVKQGGRWKLALLQWVDVPSGR